MTKMQQQPAIDEPYVLQYTIHAYSSYSANYVPQNILIDKPNDQSSRWSSENNQPPQFVTLKLAKPAIVQTITFGKFEKTHVCNLKRFKVYGGMEDNVLYELLDGGLENDNQTETFTLKYSVKGHVFPSRFIKMVPIQSWGPSFNFSIWHVQIKGNDNGSLIRDSLKWFAEYREKEAIRWCLKHFRQRNYIDVFEHLQEKTNVRLESDLLTKLYQLIVVQGDFIAAEQMIDCSMAEGLFDEYIRSQSCLPLWRSINTRSRSDRPGQRGGHQMCIDSSAEMIYLFGGWDGNRDLGDLWTFNLRKKEWRCIATDCRDLGGPSARSCHKMCLDPLRKKMFSLGRYIDSSSRCPQNLKSDFYVYDTEANKWQLITDDTAAMGGPRLVFDHQMCIDVHSNTLYVFGGKILSDPYQQWIKGSGHVDTADHNHFSGLYSYHVPTNTWKQLREDMYVDAAKCPSDDLQCQPSTSSAQQCQQFLIKSRIGHSMLFHEKQRSLYIFAGQRHRDFLSDFFMYNVDTDQVTVICDGMRNKVPAAGFTQRATLDQESNEIYVLSGLSKDRDKKDNAVKNSFWVYDIAANRWLCIYKNDNIPEDSANANSEKVEPCPRYAHQLVYDSNRKVHYLFGGNPGKMSFPKLRLDDFWTLELMRLTRTELTRRCKKLIRELNFKEKITVNIVEAVHYLQSELSATFDHSNDDEEKKFQDLASLIFQDGKEDDDDDDNIVIVPSGMDANYDTRIKVYEKLVSYFPDDLTEPKVNLLDYIQL